MDEVTADTIVLPNTFLGSYAVLAHRLRGLAAGAELHGYIAPQAEVPIRVVSLANERIELPGRSVPATRYALKMINPPPAGELDLTVWADEDGNLLRMSIPAQTVELAREDIASAAARTTTFSLAGDTPVSIPASGFNLAGTLTKPADVSTPVPAVVLIGGSGPTDVEMMKRDSGLNHRLEKKFFLWPNLAHPTLLPRIMRSMKFSAVIEIDSCDVLDRISSDVSVSVARICFSHCVNWRAQGFD